MRSHAISWCVVVGCLGAGCGLDSQGLSLRSVDGGGSQASAAGTIANVEGGADVGSSVGSDGGGGAMNSESGTVSGEGGVAAILVGTDSGGAGTNGGGGGSTVDGSVAAADASATCGVCPQGQQQCDPTLGCVTCTMDSHCPASARFCLLGSCVQCKTNANCGGTTPSCWPSSNMCRAACTSNQQCAQDGNARICNAATGACVGCTSAADCPTSQGICDPTTQQCVQCSTSADCAGTSTPACLRNRCAQCATNADCSGGTPYCATGGDSPGRCVQCLQSAQCPPSMPSCNGGTCGKSGG